MASKDNQNIDKEKALAYYQNLYIIAVADSHLALEESQFLVQVSQHFGISSREAIAIMSNIKKLDFIIPEDEAERKEHFQGLVKMMTIDKKIHDKEYQLCLAYAQKIGFSQATLDDILSKEGV